MDSVNSAFDNYVANKYGKTQEDAQREADEQAAQARREAEERKRAEDARKAANANQESEGKLHRSNSIISVDSDTCIGTKKP